MAVHHRPPVSAMLVEHAQQFATRASTALLHGFLGFLCFLRQPCMLMQSASAVEGLPTPPSPD